MEAYSFDTISWLAAIFKLKYEDNITAFSSKSIIPKRTVFRE